MPEDSQLKPITPTLEFPVLHHSEVVQFNLDKAFAELLLNSFTLRGHKCCQMQALTEDPLELMQSLQPEERDPHNV